MLPTKQYLLTNIFYKYKVVEESACTQTGGMGLSVLLATVKLTAVDKPGLINVNAIGGKNVNLNNLKKW